MPHVESLKPSQPAERPSLEAIQAMIESPSELALQRIEWLGVDHTVYVGDTKRLGLSPMQYFLNGYSLDHDSLGFYDEVVEALHGNEEQFNALLRGAVDRTPSLLVRHPRIFEPLYNQEEIRHLHRVVGNKQGVLYEHFNNLIACCSDEERLSVANKHALQAGNIPFNPAVTILAYTTELSVSEKRRALKRAITGKHAFNQSPLSYYGAGYDGKVAQVDVAVAIDSAKKLITQGIVDPTELCDTLNLLLGELRPKNLRALEAKLVLTAAEVLPSDSEGPSCVVSMGRTFIQKSLEYESNSFDAFRLVVSGLFPHDEASAIIKAHDEAKGTSIQQEFETRVRCFQDKEPFNHELYKRSEHKDTDLVKRWHQAYVVERQSWEGLDTGDMLRRLLPYTGSEKALVRDIIECWHASHPLSMWQDDVFDKYEKLFDDEPNRLRAIIEKNIDTEKQLKFALQCWRPVADFMDFSKDKMRELALARVTEDSMYNARIWLGQILDADEPLLTKYECLDVLLEKMQKDEIDSTTAFGVKHFAEQHLGRDLTEQYLFPLFGELPELEAAFGYTPHIARQRLNQDDMYEIYRNSFSLNALAEYLTDTETEQFVAKILELPPELVADAIYTIWDDLSGAQKEQAVGSILRNPALADLTFSGVDMKLVHEAMSLDLEDGQRLAILEQGPSIDLLERYAPKAFATYRRRLASKDARVATARDIYASPDASPEIRAAAHRLIDAHYARLEQGGTDGEGRRRDILTHYAYYYDLCIRLEAFMGAATIPAHIRGKNEPKNELRSLELFTLLHEAGGVANLSDIDGMSKAELEAQALYAVLDMSSIGNSEKEVVKQYLQANNVDLVKFGMWLHASSRSQKLTEYMAPFIKHLGAEGDITSWKKAQGNNMTGTSPYMLDSWLGEESTAVTFGNNATATIRFTNDINALYLCGARPVDNCLHYAYGLNQRALPGLLSADVKMVQVENENGNPIGNAIIRIAYRNDKPRVVIEPLYTSIHQPHDSDELHRAVIAATEEYARSLGLPLVNSIIRNFGRKMYDAARLLWTDSDTKEERVALVATTAPYTYGDGAGIRSKRVSTWAQARLAETT